MQGFLASELEKGHTGTYHVPMLGNFRAMVGQCWANRCLCWAYVEPFAAYVGPMVGHLMALWGSMAISGRNIPKRKLFVWDIFLGHLKGYVGPMLGHFGPFWVYVGPMLGHFVGQKNSQRKNLSLVIFRGSSSRIHWAIFGRFGSMLGPCWAIWWAFWGSMQFSGGKKQPPTQSFCVEGYFGRLFGTPWANVGPFWVYVGPMLGFHGGLWREKTNPNGKACPLGFILGDFLGLCRANVGPFWVYVGPMLGH